MAMTPLQISKSVIEANVGPLVKLFANHNLDVYGL